MRARGARGRLRCAAGEENDRLSGRRARTRERPAVAEVLKVDSDELRRLMRGEGLDKLPSLDVGLVSQRNEAREAEPEVRGEQTDLEREVAALRDEADRARDQVLGAELEPGVRVVDAEAVRAHEDGAGGTDALDDRLLSRAPVGAHLAEARADGDERPRACLERVLHRFLETRGRHRDHDEVGRLR